jgi:hypothetical protein
MVLASAENGFLPGQRTPERPVAIHLEAQGVAETPALPGVAPAASALLVSYWRINRILPHEARKWRNIFPFLEILVMMADGADLKSEAPQIAGFGSLPEHLSKERSTYAEPGLCRSEGRIMKKNAKRKGG